MHRRFGSLMFLLLLVGCVAVPGTTAPVASLTVPPAHLASSSPLTDSSPPTAATPDLGNGQSEAQVPLVPVTAVLDPTAADLALDPALDEEEALDAETLEDNAVLQADDVSPPEEEGETVPLEDTGLDFPLVDNDKVRYFVDYFSGPVHKTMRNWLERSTRYLPMMQEIFAEAGLPRDLVYLAMIESGFNNKALSRASASGPWQFMEGTGRLYGLSTDWWRDERRDPEKATRAAARHLADLYTMFEGDWYLAMAAYNAGAGKINRAIERYGTRDFWELSHGSYLKDETKRYVPKMLAALQIAKHPERYGFTELDYQEPLAFDLVEVDSVTDVQVIARLAGSDYETVKRLNPELKRWSTPPGVSRYPVRVPAGSGSQFAERYARLPVKERANFVVHKVRKGDTPGALARRYGVRTDDLLRFNKVRNARSLRVGQNLLIPLNPEAGRMSLAEVRESLRDDRPAAKSSARAGQPVSYTVRSGDSLWKISRRFAVSEKQLRAWNGLGSKSLLKPGQKLVIAAASPGKARTAAVSERPTAQTSRAELQKIVYQVRPGDTLWAIGRQFDVDSDQIRDWNKLPRGSVLRPGQRLTLLVKSVPRA